MTVYCNKLIKFGILLVGILLIFSTISLVEKSENLQEGFFVYNQTGINQLCGSPFTFYSSLKQGDYEARDMYNRLVRDSRAKESLRQLFLTGFYELLVTKEIYSFVKVFSVLQDKLNLAKMFIVSAIGFVFDQTVHVILPQIKRLFLCLLPVLFSAIILLRFFTIPHFSSFNTPVIRVAPPGSPVLILHK